MNPEEKTHAFRVFDFESNSNWKEYLRRVDISGPDENTKLLKLKAKWYKREVDSEFDYSWLAKFGTSRLNKSTDESASASSATASQSGSSTSRPSTASARPVPIRSPPFILTLLHFLVLCLGIMSLFPLSPDVVQQTFLQLVALSSVLKVLNVFGRPNIRPLTELRQWAQRAMNTTDCQYGFMALLFLRGIPTKLVFIPATVLAAYHVLHFFRTKFGDHSLWKRYGNTLYTRMTNHQNDALMLNAVSEIGTGFVLAIQLINSFRNILPAFLYWQWLRMRFWSPDSSAIHRNAWANLGRRAEPLFRTVPFLRIPVSFIQKWFTQM